MRFIALYPYATAPEENAENIRDIVDGLSAGDRDVSFESALIQTGTASNFYIGNLDAASASITSADITSATIVSARVSGLFILTTPTVNTVTFTDHLWYQMFSGYAVRLMSVTL